ncbi:dephospho-CoA kinase [Sporosarcina sp. ANT_H38]|uniref:dephospho-CoA kinase n=1 Tax=Sporosarcina sp. ANT_H38 TaxID=2597358 RepID=UPI0011F10552|nr:dephospho-CoA kinase [Sporosarcina sp. ANT_H38]KAA0965174.1 dephospho-CoA kinase [Sporosarcina sp. ANT_H38]
MIIGLTGSIASGKSTVSKMLQKKGFPIVDADEIAHLVVEPGSPVLLEISRVFGQGILRADGSLNREKMGERIFGNVEERQKLNSIIHPAIRKEMMRQKEQWISTGSNTVIMDIPLLFESGLQSFVDKIIVVSVTPEIQKERLIARNVLSEEEADARIRSQLPMDEKELRADAVLHNNGPVEDTESQLTEVLSKWNIKK